MNDPSATEFDKEYYEKLLDGLEAIEIDLSVCKNIIDFRIDASTYKKDYVQTDEILKSLNAGSIEDKMNSIQNFGAYSLCNDIEFTDYGIPFLMTQNVRHNYIDWNNIRYISETSHKMLHKSHCKKGQVLVTMAGEYLGRVAVYDRDFICSSNQAIAKVTLKDGVSPYYVATFLNSRYGQNQINRFRTVTGQPNINMALIKSLKIPFFSDKFGKVIESIVMYSNEMFRRANNYYQEGEKLLIETLGLELFAPEADRYSIKTFKSSYGNKGRLDAEFYQQKYDDLFNMLSRFPCKKLGDIVAIRKSIEPGSDSYSDEGIPFVRVGDISQYGITQPTIKLPYNLIDDIEDLFPAKGTILLSKDGSVGIAYKIEESDSFITSSALLHLHVLNENEINLDYLTLVLNSRVVQMQAERDAGGSIIQHWKPSEIAEVVIPILDKNIQDNISNRIKKSFELRKKSQIILEQAICLIETAIEQGEDIALKIQV